MPHFGALAANDSKGCGGVMRMAPVGLYAARLGAPPYYTFRLGVELAALTHGHRTGRVTAGAFAVMVAALCGGASQAAALDVALAQVREGMRRRSPRSGRRSRSPRVVGRATTPSRRSAMAGSRWNPSRRRG